MKEEMIKVLAVPPREKPYEMEIPNTRKAMEEIVQGDVEAYEFNDCVLVRKRNGSKDGSLPYRKIPIYDSNIVYGTYFLCNASNAFPPRFTGLTSLSSKQIEIYTKNGGIPLKYQKDKTNFREPER